MGRRGDDADLLPSWWRGQLRDLDTSVPTLLRQLLRAVAGTVGAFVATRIVADRVGVAPGDFTAQVLVFIPFATISILLTSGIPIRNLLVRQRRAILEHDLEIRRVAATDPLTGLSNRRSLEAEVGRLRDANTPYAVAMSDLDDFRHLNDEYGHETGDRALRLFASALRDVVRSQDVLCRYGGEEFVIVFPECAVLEAAPIVHRMRAELSRLFATGTIPPFTASFGLADSTYAPDFEHVLALADEAMFRAKEIGGDQLLIADDCPEVGLGP